MIEFLSIWAEQIVVAVIIATIIEMILPNGNNKKYIKAVIGIYILFTIISPILGKITKIDLDKIDYEKYFNELESKETISDGIIEYNDNSVEEIYKSNLIQDMKLKLKERGYNTNDISADIEFKDEKNYGKVNAISISLYKVKEINENDNNYKNTIQVNKIEEVKIGTNKVNTAKKENLNKSEIDEIKNYLASVYEVKKKNIKINE